MPRTKEAFEAMRQATRQKIEMTALSLFARKGMSVKVEEIADAAGVSQGLIYSHYPSKNALIVELVRQGATISSQSILEIAGTEGTAAAKINQVSDMMSLMFSDYPVGIDYFMFMVQAGMSGSLMQQNPYDSGGFPDPVKTFAEIIAQGQREGSVVPGDPQKISLVYWATIQGLCCYAVTGMLVSPESRILNRMILKEDFL